MHCHSHSHHIIIFASILYLKSPFSPSCISQLMNGSPGTRADYHNACWLPSTLRGASLPAEHPPSLPSFPDSHHLLPAQEGPPGKALRMLTLFPSCFLSPISSPCVWTPWGHLPTHWEGHQRHHVCPAPDTQHLTPCFEGTINHSCSLSLPLSAPESTGSDPCCAGRKEMP